MPVAPTAAQQEPMNWRRAGSKEGFFGFMGAVAFQWGRADYF
jgi:hypothetical protein